MSCRAGVAPDGDGGGVFDGQDAADLWRAGLARGKHLFEMGLLEGVGLVVAQPTKIDNLQGFSGVIRHR